MAARWNVKSRSAKAIGTICVLLRKSGSDAWWHQAGVKPPRSAGQVLRLMLAARGIEEKTPS
jgi:hypothetical protein